MGLMMVTSPNATPQERASTPPLPAPLSAPLGWGDSARCGAASDAPLAARGSCSVGTGGSACVRACLCA